MSSENKGFTDLSLKHLISKIKSTFVDKTDAVETTSVNVDSVPTAGSNNLITSGGVYNELEDKVDKVEGKGLSTNDYTTTEKTKLSGIESGAEVNAINSIQVNGVTQPISNKAVDITVPTALSELNDNSTHRTVTDTEKATWNSKYMKPSGGIPVSDLEPGVLPEILPSYVISEAEATIAKSFSHGNLGRTIRFIAVSDSHNDSNNMSPYSSDIVSGNKHCGQAIKYIADRIGLDFVAFLGDATWAGVADVASSYTQQMLINDIEQFNSFIADGYKGIPNVRCVGNHDQLYTTGDTSARLWNSGAYNLFGRFCEGKKDNPSGYGFIDVDNAKVRVIYINTSDIPSDTRAGTYLGMTQTQKNWICETLIDLNTKTDAAQWSILVLSHAPNDFSSAVDIASDILVPYTNGGAYGSYTFTNHGAKIIANVHGHVHSYVVGYMNDKIRRFAIPNANPRDNNHYRDNPTYSKYADAVTYNKTANSGDDTAFSLVTIDLDSNMCYVDNYGAGIDREFSCDYNTSIVPTSLSDISYSGVTTVGSSIDTSAFTYTVHYSDGSTKLKTTTVVVSPSTIAVIGSNSVTISYTENGTTVSANTTITGTAAPVVNLFVKTPTYNATSTPTDIDEVALKGRINSSGKAVVYGSAGEDAFLTTRYISCSVGDTFTVASDKANDYNNYTGDVNLYKADGTFIGSLTKATTAWSWSTDKLTGTITIPSSYGTKVFTDAAKARFTIAYSDIDSISITR